MAFEHPDLTGVGPVGGDLDFLSSNVTRTANIAKCGDFAKSPFPNFFFGVLNGKSFATVGTPNA